MAFIFYFNDIDMSISEVRIPIIEALLQQVPSSTKKVTVLAFDIEVMEILGAEDPEEFLCSSAINE